MRRVPGTRFTFLSAIFSIDILPGQAHHSSIEKGGTAMELLGSEVLGAIESIVRASLEGKRKVLIRCSDQAVDKLLALGCYELHLTSTGCVVSW